MQPQQTAIPDPARAAILGVGYVGLPLLIECARAGLAPIGYDLDEQVVSTLCSGVSHVQDVSDEDLVDARRLGATFGCSRSVLGDASTFVVCVPSPLHDDRSPDLTAILAAADDIAAVLRPGSLVVLESTSYPGTTDGPFRQHLEASGLVAGEDFSLAFSPERIDPGNPRFGLATTPKVVGGLTSSCTAAAVEFYARLVNQVVPVSTTRVAELAKLLENTYRHVNIALVNELAIYSHALGIDLWETIDAAATKPFGFEAFRPGPGVGGHCIPIDPTHLTHSVRQLGYRFRLVELAQEINERMPYHVVRRLQDALNDRRTALRDAAILVLGLTYKADVADARESPANDVVRHLRQRGAHVVAHDPFLDEFVVDGVPVEITACVDSATGHADAVVVLQAHSSYDLEGIAASSSLVLDTRGVMTGPTVVRL